MKEFELIQAYFSKRFESHLSQTNQHGVVLGIGDDCALLSPRLNHELAITVDTSVADRHFPVDAPAYAIGYRALAVNLSDLAAMGATPRWITLAITLPEVDQNWLADFSKGLADLCFKHNVMLVGGDTTKGSLSITIQAMGEVETGKALRRDGAKAGDKIYVVGELGLAHAGLKHWFELPESQQNTALIDIYLKPKPKVQEGLVIAPFATSAIDISDGLMADLGHICERSSHQNPIQAHLYLSQLSLAQVLYDGSQIGEKTLYNPIDAALAGGDDYALCFTVSTEQEANLLRSYVEQSKQQPLSPLTCIGEIKVFDLAVQHKEKVICWDDSSETLKPYSISETGFQHF